MCRQTVGWSDGRTVGAGRRQRCGPRALRAIRPSDRLTVLFSLLAFLLLASPLAAYVTGAALAVHGGGEWPGYLPKMFRASGDGPS